MMVEPEEALIPRFSRRLNRESTERLACLSSADNGTKIQQVAQQSEH